MLCCLLTGIASAEQLTQTLRDNMQITFSREYVLEIAMKEGVDLTEVIGKRLPVLIPSGDQQLS